MAQVLPSLAEVAGTSLLAATWVPPASEQRDQMAIAHQDVVHADELGGALDRVQFGLRGREERVVLGVAPAQVVAAAPVARTTGRKAAVANAGASSVNV